MRRFLAAVRFLTIFPIPGSWGTAESDLRQSPMFFPLVGLALGGISAILGAILWAWLPAWPAAAIMVAIMALYSGGLHMDGLADTADGFLSSRPRERVLEIMRDSHVGSMGVLALVCIALIKAASLSSVPKDRLAETLLLMPLAGRCSQVMGISLLPYARKEIGLGSIFFENRSMAGAWMGIGSLTIPAVILSGWTGVALTLCASVSFIVFSAICIRRIGGATGDTLGAMTEIAEVMPCLVMAHFGME